MSVANLIMLALGIVAFVAGAAILARRGGGEQAVYARRIAGVMVLSLGLILAVFAIGLSDLLEGPAHA